MNKKIFVILLLIASYFCWYVSPNTPNDSYSEPSYNYGTRERTDYEKIRRDRIEEDWEKRRKS